MDSDVEIEFDPQPSRELPDESRIPDFSSDEY
jgi:hypothetical protein